MKTRKAVILGFIVLVIVYGIWSWSSMLIKPRPLREHIPFDPDMFDVEIRNLTHSPALPELGQEIVFQADFAGDPLYPHAGFPKHPLSNRHISEDLEVKIWWLSNDEDHSSVPEWGGGGTDIGPRLDEPWKIPNKPGGAIYMPIIHTEPYPRDTEQCTLVVTSEARTFTVGNASVVFDSPKIQVTIEDKGGSNLTSYPCARVVAQIPREGGKPSITDLRIDYTYYALQGNFSIPPWRQFSDHSYVQYPDPPLPLRRDEPYTSGSYDFGHTNLRNRFWANGTQTDDSMIYIFEPEYRMRACWADPCTGEGLFMVWVAGWDLNGTIHFATPITYTSSIPLNPPPQPGQPGYEDHR